MEPGLSSADRLHGSDGLARFGRAAYTSRYADTRQRIVVPAPSGTTVSSPKA